MNEPQIHQLLAKEPTVKAAALRTLTAAHHNLGKPALLSGLARVYAPLIDGGEQLPPESTRVQLNTLDAIAEVRGVLATLYDLTATKDAANQQARADIVVHGLTLAADVPVMTLLSLEKHLTDLSTFISKLPVADQAEDWHHDRGRGHLATHAVRTLRTRKVPRNHVKAEATDKHPAQVEVYYEDVPVGEWSTVKYSGALQLAQVAEMGRRVRELQQAVAEARQRANSTPAPAKSLGAVMLGYVFD